MVVLLSNDDGYEAKGINILKSVLEERGHRILVAAPETEQSGKSHSMTIHSRLKVTKVSDDYYIIGGTPADCIIYSIYGKFFSVTPDVVIGGINHGYNQSADILFSGTCAVARQASLFGIKAIALSSETGDDGILERTARFAADNLDYFLSVIRENTFLNINVPLNFNGEGRPAGVGLCDYDDRVDAMRQYGAVTEFQIRGEGVFHFEVEGERFPADHVICRQGYASLSLVDDLPHISRHMGDIRV